MTRNGLRELLLPNRICPKPIMFRFQRSLTNLCSRSLLRAGTNRGNDCGRKKPKYSDTGKRIAGSRLCLQRARTATSEECSQLWILKYCDWYVSRLEIFSLVICRRAKYEN